jgi:TolA-binding protein
VEALYGIQWAYVQLGDYEQARQEATSFLKLFPSSGLAAEVQLMVAESFRREKNTRDAVEQYRELIEKYPDSGSVPSARLKMGETQEEGGDFIGAQKTYADLIARHPDHPLAKEAAFRLGVARFAAGNTEGAAEVFAKVASDYADPRAPEALYNLLLCKKKKGDLEGMREIQKKLAGDFPRTRAAAQASLSLAYHYQDAGHSEEAVPFLDSVASCPFTDLSSEAASALGDYWSGRGEKELALKSYLKGAEGLPKGGEWTVSSALSASVMLRAESRDDEAIDLLRRILEKDDAQPEWLASARLGIAQSYEASGRTKQARLMYVEVIKGGAPAEIRKQAEARIAALEAGQAGSATSLRDSGGKKTRRKPAASPKSKAKKSPVKNKPVKGRVKK